MTAAVTPMLALVEGLTVFAPCRLSPCPTGPGWRWVSQEARDAADEAEAARLVGHDYADEPIDVFAMIEGER